MLKFKRFIQGWLWRLDEVLPRGIAIWTKNRCWPGRAVLDVIEVHLSDTCNLNCQGCFHFSPFSKPCFAKVADVEKDFVVLRKKFVAVRHVHLLGGEPLLNGECGAFLRMTRRLWPGTRLSFVTNGLLLMKQNVAFWRDCRETRTMIDMTWYPVMAAETKDAIERKCREEGVVLRITRAERFLDKFREEGAKDAAASYRACRRTQYCPYLREGRLYPCATAYHLADRMPAQPREAGIDIRTHSSQEIMRYLLTPVEVCRFCAERPGVMDWRRMGARPNDKGE